MEVPALPSDPEADQDLLRERMKLAVKRSVPCTLDHLANIFGRERNLPIELLINSIAHTPATSEHLDSLADRIACGPEPTEQVGKLLRLSTPTPASLYLAARILLRILPNHPFARVAELTLLSCQSAFDIRLRADFLEIRRSNLSREHSEATALILDQADPAHKWMVCRARRSEGHAAYLCLSPEVASFGFSTTGAEPTFGEGEIMTALRSRPLPNEQPFVQVQRPILDPCVVSYFAVPVSAFF